MSSYRGIATFCGNVTSEPVMRFTAGAKAVINLSLACSNKSQDGTESTVFIDLTAWEKMAENIGASITKGDRVVVYVEPDPQQWASTKEEGKIERRLKWRILDIGPSLLYTTAEINRTERTKAPKAVDPSDPMQAPFDDGSF